MFAIKTMRPPFAALLACVLALPLYAAPAVASVTPADFEDVIITKVNGPVGLAFTPDGRLVMLSQFGRVHVYKDGAQLPSPALDISAKLCSDKERGLLGIAIDPAFSTNHFVFLYYTYKKFGVCDYDTPSSPVNRVSRFVLPDSNVVDPTTEVVLIDNIPQPDGIHNAGDLHFGKDGFLYVSVGDGGCDYAGNSGCGSQNDASRDQHVLLGKILRIDRNGGVPPTNPFLGADSARCNATGRTDPGKKCQETFSWGLRNPWRFAFDPNAQSTKFFVNDVGQATWEEIDQGQPGADFGWNVREGHCARGSSTDCGPPPAGMTNPVYDYNHSTGCTSITGAAFVPNGIWPSAFDGTYLYGDFVCGKIIRLTPAAQGGFTPTDFITGLGTNSVTTMKFGPYGTSQALYYMNYLGGGEVHRVRFTGSANRAPTAVATADVTSGPVPLTVHFNGTGSTDPDGDLLTFDWNFGDGTAHSTSATPTHIYNSVGTFTATLAVSDGRGGQNAASLRIDAGNTAPTATITSPSTSKRFKVGEVITLHGSATDPQDGQLPNGALSWTVIKHHDTHVHPFLPPTSGNDIPITMPDPEDLAATTTTYLEIQLTATDSGGLASTTTQNLYPNVVNVTFSTQPSGLTVSVNGTTFVGPSTIPSWEAYALNVNAPDQADGSGQPWTFGSWSDGGAAAHAIVTPASAVSYTATFAPATSTTVFGDDFELGNLSRWTGVTGVVVQNQLVRGGSWAARATSSGAAAFAYEQFPTTYSQLYYRHRVNVVSQRSGNLTLGRFLTSTGSGIVAVYRSTSGKLCLRNETTSSATCSGTRLSTGAWHDLQVRTRVGTAGETEVWLDGIRITALSGTQALGTIAIGRIQLGNNQTGTTHDVAFDDVAVSTAFVP